MSTSLAGRCRRPGTTVGHPPLLSQILEEFLDPGKEAFAFGMGAAAFAFVFELAQQFLLPLGQVDRSFDHRLDEHVTTQG